MGWIFGGKEEIEDGSVAVNSLLKDAKITGDINMDGDLKIDGNVEGNINIDGKLVIGKNGKVTGFVNCKSLKVIGRLDGNVKSTSIVSISSIGILIGDIDTERVQIENGGVFVGNVKMDLYEDVPELPQEKTKKIVRKR